MRRIRGLARQMSVVCSLASVSMLAVALYVTLCYSSGPKITLDCISVYSNSQQPASAKQSGAAQQLTETQNEDRSDAVHSDTVSSCNTPACTLDRETVLDHSKCPLNRPFLVYVYNTHLPDLFELKHPSVLATLGDSTQQHQNRNIKSGGSVCIHCSGGTAGEEHFKS